MKKTAELFLITVSVLIMTACGQQQNGTPQESAAAAVSTQESAETQTEKKPDRPSESPAATEATDTADGVLKIAVISVSDGNAGCFIEDINKGTEAFIKGHSGCTATQVGISDSDKSAILKKVENTAEDYDVVVCCGYQFSGIYEAAEKYPDDNFILVDSTPVDSAGNVIVMKNVYSMCFREQESGFCAGMAAALQTKTGKVAVVNGVAYPSNVDYQYGFMCGVKYVNETENRNAECVEIPAYAGKDVSGRNVGGNYIGNFNDRAAAREISKELIRRGCDVIFAAAGSAGRGVFDAAKNARDVYVIGCDTDQYDDGVNGNSNVVLTSVLRVMHTNITKQLDNIVNGSFSGENELLGAVTDSTGFVSEKGRCQLTDENIKKINDAYGKVREGTIIPSYYGGSTVPDTFTW